MGAPFTPKQHSINADLSRLKEARDFAEDACVEFGLQGESLYMVKLAMSEAVTNAIQHGSSRASDPIRLTVLEEGDALVFEVEDTGHFVPRVPRRGAVPERGRGLGFMRQLMDEVDVRPRREGTLLRFAKRR
jgi:anti-sigma regulatory factor (Ser/Thr protein kinase)